MPKTKKKAKSNTKTLIGAGLASLLLILLGAQVVKSGHVSSLKPTPIPTIVQQISIPIVSSDPTAKCHIQGVLPDPNCTSGAVDPKVTQANIHQTICVSGYTKTVRPSTNYTNKLKIQQITEYGYSDTTLKDYEEDHLISLELGGAPSDPKNLWPEPGGSPNPKDHIENLCHKKVCDGGITLAEAQKQISTNWQTACQ